jgi:hypothetical protein
VVPNEPVTGLNNARCSLCNVQIVLCFICSREQGDVATEEGNPLLRRRQPIEAANSLALRNLVSCTFCRRFSAEVTVHSRL